MRRIPLIIDTDPGVDDFFCLAMACARPQIFDLRAVTTVGGNHSTDVTTRNALDILDLLGNTAPVSKGACRFLTEEFGEPVVSAHGHNGIGDQILPASKRKPTKEPAWDTIHRIAGEEKGQLLLVTIGPLTNPAIALLKYPSLRHQIRKIVMMGGTNGTGNIGPYSEANAGHDPLAARIVFESGIPIDMVGLDTTRQCTVLPEEFEDMSADTDPVIRNLMRELIRFRHGEAMHDSAAFAALADPEMVRWIPARVRVETGSPLTAGMTEILPDEETGTVRVASEPNRQRYLQVLRDTLTYYRRKTDERDEILG